MSFLFSLQKKKDDGGVILLETQTHFMSSASGFYLIFLSHTFIILAPGLCVGILSCFV